MDPKYKLHETQTGRINTRSIPSAEVLQKRIDVALERMCTGPDIETQMEMSNAILNGDWKAANMAAANVYKMLTDVVDILLGKV